MRERKKESARVITRESERERERVKERERARGVDLVGLKAMYSVS